MAKITRKAAGKAALKILKLLLDLIVFLLTYIGQCFDRLLLVPFPIVSHYSLFEMAEKDNKYSTYSAARILFGILCIGIWAISKWLF